MVIKAVQKIFCQTHSWSIMSHPHMHAWYPSRSKWQNILITHFCPDPSAFRQSLNLRRIDDWFLDDGKRQASLTSFNYYLHNYPQLCVAFNTTTIIINTHNTSRAYVWPNGRDTLSGARVPGARNSSDLIRRNPFTYRFALFVCLFFYVWVTNGV